MSDVFGVPYADVDVALTCANASDEDGPLFTGCAIVGTVALFLAAMILLGLFWP